MSEYSLRPQARRDLADIDDYTISRWGEDAAADYLRAIGKALERVAANPEIGAERSQFHRDLRKADVERHHAYYLPVKDGIDVVRILHPSMDARAQLKTGLNR